MRHNENDVYQEVLKSLKIPERYPKSLKKSAALEHSKDYLAALK